MSDQRHPSETEGEDFFRLAESVPHIVWSASPDGNLYYCSQRGLDLLGATSPEEMHGMSWDLYVHPNDRGRVLEAWEASIQNRTVYRSEQRLKSAADDSWRWFLVEATPVTGPDGEIDRYYGISTDIHDRKVAEQERAELEQKLQVAQKLEVIGRLTGGVAHDFNNVLTTILGGIELLKMNVNEGLGTKELALEPLEIIEIGARHAAALTRQLLSYGRRRATAHQPLQLRSVIHEMELLLPKLVSSRVALQIDVPADLPPVKADPSDIEQILFNLVFNADDAMPDGGHVQIRAFRSGDTVAVQVVDDGCGMDETTADQVFEPFFSTKSPDRGTGLGLTTVRDIVERLGGVIDVSSEIGIGTTFSIRLPSAKGHRVSDVIERPPLGAKTGEVIMIVDDHDSVLRLVQRFLTTSGYQVLTADRPSSALAQLSSGDHRVDLLITDVSLDGEDGCDLATQARELRSDIPVLFISGLVREPHVEPWRSSAPLLPKPFTRQDLLQQVRNLLDAEEATK